MMEGALSRQTAQRLIEAATAAPSMHNSQPWRFVARLADRVIEIYADPKRTLSRGDPRGRAVHIACGAALFNLRLAVSLAGAEPIARLLPSPRNPLLLAAVRVAGPYRPRPAERDLYAAIGVQPGNGHTGQVIPRRVLAALTEAAALEGATLRLLEQPDALRLLQATAAADRELRTDPSYLAELAAFAGAPRLAKAGGNGSGPHGSGPAGRPVLATFEPVPPLAVITTAADDRASWLRAGQAMQRVLLLATHRGLLAAPLTPVPEGPDAPLHGDPRLGGEHPAMILRLGGGRAGPTASRRPVAQVMRVISPVMVRPAGNVGQDERPAAGPPPALAPEGRELLPSK